MPGFSGVGDFAVGEIDSPGGGGASTSPATSFKKNSPGCGCCCPCADTCGGDTPCRWTLTTSDGLNVVAGKLTGPTGSNAIWYGSIAATTYKGCSYDRVLFYHNAGVSKLEVQLYSSTTSNLITWRSATDPGLPFDCESAYTLAYLSNSGSCTPSGTPGSMTATPGRFVECANGDSSVDCGHCIEGTAPPRFKVVLSGMGTASGISPPCGDADGTYYCDYSGTGLDGCTWILDTGTTVCTSNLRYMRVIVGPAQSPGHRSIAVWFTSTSGGVSGHFWYENTCATPCDVADCGIFNDTLLDDFSPESVSGGCRVTAIY